MSRTSSTMRPAASGGRQRCARMVWPSHPMIPHAADETVCGMGVELLAPHRRPAALLPDVVHHRGIVRPGFLTGLLIGGGHVAGAVNGHRQRRLADLPQRLVVAVDE